MGCRLVTWLWLAVLLALGGGPSFAHGPFEPAPMVVEGEVVDLACYVAQGVRGRENAVCSSRQTSPDQPLALIADDGGVYLLYSYHESPHPHDRCRELAGRRVRLTGVPAEGHGLRLLAVRKVRPLDDQEKPR